MHIPANKHVLLGVTGSIATYRLPSWCAGGAEFVTPLTFQALSGNPLDTGVEAAMGHIELARWADAVVVAPTLTNVIACLAEAPVAVAPVMNQQM